LLAGITPGCSGEILTDGVTEPIAVSFKSGGQIVSGQFKEGALPGEPAPPAGTPDDELSAPRVTTTSAQTRIVTAGDVGKKLTGLATKDADAVAVKLDGAGTGYWLVTVGGADSSNDDQLEWNIALDVNVSAPVGLHDLLFAAFGPGGHAGTQRSFGLCVVPEIPDTDADGNHNACDPKVKPPEFVVSLAWDRPVDLDLHVVTPDGKIVDAKHPTTGKPDSDGHVDPTEDGIGVMDIDSNAACAPVGRQREDLVFRTKPPKGTYYAYANLFDACGESSVRFDLSFRTAAAGKEPDTFKVESVDAYERRGSFVAVQANGGAKIGTFVTEFVIQ
jgi:hypothetical protein